MAYSSIGKVLQRMNNRPIMVYDKRLGVNMPLITSIWNTPANAANLKGAGYGVSVYDTKTGV